MSAQHNNLDKFVMLPLYEDMLRRLTPLSYVWEVQTVFFPLLFRQAGKELTVEGIVLMLLDAASCMSARYPSIIYVLLIGRLSQFIDALIDDKEFAQEAKRLLPQLL